MVMRQFFSPGMCIYLRSQCLMLTFRYLLWSSCSVQPLVVPTGRKMVFLAMKSATVRESARNRWKSSHRNRSKAVLVLSEIFWECFVASASSRPYQAQFSRWISCQLTIFSNDRLVSWTRLFPFPRQLRRRLSIGHEYWKRSVLSNITNLACVPLEQARMDSTKVTNYKKKKIK